MKNNYFIGILLLGCAAVYAQPTTFGAGAGAAGNNSNSYFGASAGASNTAINNTFIGSFSGFTNTLGIGNSFLGSSTGINNQANFNTFIGSESGYNNTTGQWNTFLGASTGLNNTTGNENVFIGQATGNANTTGSFNTFVGRASGSQSMTGGFNVFVGHSSGQSTNGDHNTFVGFQSGTANTSGADNTFMGYRSGLGNTTGVENVFIGRESGFSNTSGSLLAFVGASAGVNNTTGFGNTFIGAFSGYSNNVGTSNSFVGFYSGNANSSGYELTFFGAGSGSLNTTGTANTFMGFNSGRNNTTGSDNTYLGHYTAEDNTTGARNAWVGARAGENNANGSDNTFLGFGSGQNNINGSGNVFLGHRAGQAETGSNLLYISNSNTNNPLVWGNFSGGGTVNLRGMVSVNLNPNGGVGGPTANLDVNGTARVRLMADDATQTRLVVSDVAGNLFTRDAATLPGDNLGNHIATDDIVPVDDERYDIGNTTHAFNNLYMDGSVFLDHFEFIHNRGGNIGMGLSALTTVNVGTDNVGIGVEALTATSNGSNNVAIGMHALNINSSGSGNTAVGYNAGVDSDALNNTTAIGNEARTTDHNQVHIGNSSVTEIGGYVEWSVLSDGRFKTNVKEEDIKGLAFVNKLRPVSYELDRKKLKRFLKEKEEAGSPSSARPRQAGFIAQEVEQAVKESGITFSGVQKPNSDAEHYSLQYSQFVVPLTKAVQELSVMVEDQKKMIDGQQKQIALLEKMLSEMNQKNGLANVGPSGGVPQGFALQQNHPNPFNTDTTVELVLPDAVGNAFVIIHDLNGREMKRIAVKGRGATSIAIEGMSLAAGMYLYSLVADGQVIDTKRMLLTD